MGNEFPFVEDTLGKKLAAGTGLSVYCLTCRRNALLDVAELVKRLGPDHSCMHWGLIKVIYSTRPCRRPGGPEPPVYEPRIDTGAAQGLNTLTLAQPARIRLAHHLGINVASPAR
ncbi:hypothetical protein [Mesorhizobium sp. CA5]|uniref:hypothetical protein n=1 Tax=Mesorhizobium sp. CA5 TaxID=2876638 RepID=UPI001CD0BBCA|nr:hypothetical protein [Mesorhizobium sp. CA5]MBZ9844068.1 hypothetical protein [Mesorhizobium sp. CA5]